MTKVNERKLEVEALREQDTKNKRKYLWRSLGLSGGIYIDKTMVESQQPTVIVIRLKD